MPATRLSSDNRDKLENYYRSQSVTKAKGAVNMSGTAQHNVSELELNLGSGASNSHGNGHSKM